MGCSPRIQQIVGKGKRGAAEYIKTCRSPEILNEILDRILSHEISINDSESIDWIRWLIAGGNTPENFTAIVKKYHNTSICGLVWTAQSVAYRCRTCSLSPCMSLCAECFVNGKHDGHDYNMFRSQTGGACDCGDSSVMQSSGFCSKHGTTDDSKNLLPPPDLLYIAELMAPRIFCRLILHLRNYHCRSLVGNSELHMAVDADDFLAMLGELSDMGAAMMRVLTSALTDTEIYSKLTKDWLHDDSTHATYMATSELLYQKALKSLANPEPPVEFKNCPGLQVDLIHKTFLEELVFWTVKYEFPQKLINFLLIMLPDAKYKEALTEAFVLHYSRIAMVLEQAADPDTLSKRIAKVSVQWFSNKELAVKMTENLSLLQVMVVSFKNMIERILVPAAAASSSSKSKTMTVDCKSSVVSQCRYWLFVSDLNSVLSYRPVAMKFMNDEFLVKMWFLFLSYFQGMNVNKRKHNQHIEYEQDTDSVFLAELWTTYPILLLLSHLKDETTVVLTKGVLRNCLTALEVWLQSVVAKEVVEDQVSFHIPLHRSLATFISHAVNVQQIALAEVMPPDSSIQWILSHPLRIQAAFHEIINGIWARNGLQIKKQALTYTQNDFCSSMVDADLYLLQILATKLAPNEFALETIKKFRTKNWFRFDKQVEKDMATENDDSEDAILEGFLQFWTMLCVNRINLGNTPSQNIRIELVALLCLDDRTHSQLMELMPERCGAGKSTEFDVILEEVADYKPPNFKYGGNMQQGLYTPKSRVWDELYDPIHVLLRTGMNRKDFQNTTDRFTDHLRRSKRLPPSCVPWPPYRIPPACEAYVDPRHMINGRVFHALVWMILYKYIHVNNVPENILSLTVYLLELAASVADKETSNDQETISQIDVVEQNVESWFRSDSLAENVQTVIRKVSCGSCSSSQTSHRVVEVNESIVSLLFKCHTKLAGRETFTSVENGDLSVLENRIGEGTSFVEKVLIRIVLLGEMCRKTVKNCREKLRSKMSSSSPSKCEGGRKELSEKKRKAEERRRHIMESLAKQRDKFAKENESMLALGEDKMDWQSCETSDSADNVPGEKYYCGICRKMLPSTKENPIVLLTQVQATSVLGHRKRCIADASAGLTFAEQHRNEVAALSKEFSDWTDAVTLGWEDGIYVQSCGHVFDHRCLIPIQKEEYSCPVCRQSANNVIPILANECTVGIASTCLPECKSDNNLKQFVSVVSKYLEQGEAPSEDCELFEKVVNTSLQNMRRCLSAARLARYNMTEQSSCSLLFLASVARCNAEMEIMLRGGSLVKPSQQDVCLVTKKSCILPLLKLVGMRMRKLNCKCVLKMWRQLMGVDVQTLRKTSDKRSRRCVPALLRDPVTMLLHIVLMLPPALDQGYYLWLVEILYALVNLQAAVRLSYHLTEEQRNYFRMNNDETSSSGSKLWCCNNVIRMSIEMLDAVSTRTSTQDVQLDVTAKIHELCLPFLRLACILRSHLYAEQLPEVLNEEEELGSLMQYLKLADEMPARYLELAKTWLVEVGGSRRSLEVICTLWNGDLNASWYQPTLLPLPYEYKDVFQNYQQRSCSVCQQMCEKISICLVCGTLVCLEGKCCEKDGVYEAVRHADNCGAGTGIYLTVSSSNVIIIRGPKACIWGSVYLDAYGEEDPDLKRGRPLYLSSERYHLLEHEWLSHNFNRIDDAWILHKDQL